MSRFLLDTNILVFLVSGENDCISSEVASIIEDYNNQLFVSSVGVLELLQLYRIGKIRLKNYKDAYQLQVAIEKDYFIKIIPFSKEYLNILSKLKIADGHNDPFDHSILSTAIADKLTLVSSDRQFENYTTQNLNFAFNKR